MDETGEILVELTGSDAAAGHQGSFYGLACASAELASQVWAPEVLADVPPRDVPPDAAQRLARAGAHWLQRLRDGQLGHTLLLPADDVDLAERARALGEWCQGFLVGLARGGIADIDALPGDVPEFLRDLSAITRAAADDDTEADEVAYADLVEYVRVGAQLVFEELGRLQPGPTVQ